MNHQAIVETVFKSVISTLPTELGALLGQELKCSDTRCRLATKEELFSAEPRPKSSLAHLKISGEHEGLGFLILPVKSAIVFGGTLIMLPKDQIEENVGSETLDGEVKDAYGEVANILAGVLTQVFLEKYSKSLRFVRTEIEELIDTKVDVASDKPFPPGTYFQLSAELSMDEKALGKLEIITPIALLDLEVPAAEPAVAAAPATPPQPAAPAASAAAASAAPTPEPEQPPPPAAPATAARVPFADAKKVADVVVKATLEQVAEEVGALLGQPFTCGDLQFAMVSKEEFFGTHCQDKSILTYMTVSGSRDGQIYLFNQTKDAILMGGTLIMLPDEELHDQMNKGKFEGEVADAYGEVANIISGGLTQTFLERYPQQLRFVKTTSTTVIPTKIDMATDEPMPAGLYYVASCATTLQGEALGRMLLLFPAAVLGLENFNQPEPVSAPAAASAPQAESSPGASSTTAQQQAAPAPSSQRQATPPPADATPVVLIITDAEAEAAPLCQSLTHSSYETRVIGYKDDLRAIFSAHPVLGVFLLMSEVGEKGFSVAIKLQSSGYPLPPIIAGGPAWTRSSVLKAVKYGVRDILVTPASAEEIREKSSQHLSLPA